MQYLTILLVRPGRGSTLQDKSWCATHRIKGGRRPRAWVHGHAEHELAARADVRMSDDGRCAWLSVHGQRAHVRLACRRSRSDDLQ